MSEGKRLYSAFYKPLHNHEKGYLICHPFADEKKSTQNFFVDLAKNLCLAGYLVVLFDLNGCGDSEGNFKDASITSWLDDINNIYLHIKKTFEIKNIGFIGLRFSAYLGMLSLNNSLFFNRLILIEPIFNVRNYFEKLLRGKLIKELHTYKSILSDKGKFANNLDKNKFIDIDGYEISSGFYLDLVKHQESFDIKNILISNSEIYLFKISLINKVPSEFELFIKYAHNVKKEIHFKLVKYLPFWNNLDPIKHEILRQELIYACTS